MRILFFCTVCGAELETSDNPAKIPFVEHILEDHTYVVSIKPCSVCPDPKKLVKEQVTKFIKQLEAETHEWRKQI